MTVWGAPPSHAAVKASSDSQEKSIQQNLKRIKKLTVKIRKQVNKGKSSNKLNEELAELLAIAGEIAASDEALKEVFSDRDDEVSGLGSAARKRHEQMRASYEEAMEEFKTIIAELSAGGADILSTVERLESFLDRLLYDKKSHIYGSLPYRHLSYPARTPASGDSITPAYLGGNGTAYDEDIAVSPEAPVNEEIAALAQQLQWSPVLIYEWVKNNVETQWYWGCMKGAVETMHQLSGNDCDQATLLVALLRASNYPARYIRGTVEMQGDLGLGGLLGMDEWLLEGGFLQKAGVPYENVIMGGHVSNIRFEHVWVEAYIPYSNYRGVIIDEHGKVWLPLDTSIKVAGYTDQGTVGVAASMDLASLRDEYLSTVQSASFLDYVRSSVENHLAQSSPGAVYEDALHTLTMGAEQLDIVPAALQYNVINVSNEFTSVPADLLHTVRFEALDPSGGVLMDTTVDAFELAGHQVAIAYEPETTEDQDTINAFGGLALTPAYLVNLRPALTIDGERMSVGTEGLTMGSDHTLRITFKSPTGEAVIEDSLVAGSLTVIGISAGGTSDTLAEAPGVTDGERMLQEVVREYGRRWDEAEAEFAALLNLRHVRPVPSMTSVGGMMDVTYLFDTPHEMEWRGIYMDAGFRAVEAVSESMDMFDDSIVDGFMALSALEAAGQEHRVFEDLWGIEAISTDKLLGYARDNGVEVLSVDSTNADTVLPGLPYDDEIISDIEDAVNQGYFVTVPAQDITYQDWTGTGYVKEDPETRAAGYMLSGMVAGGMTVGTVTGWPSLQFMALGEEYGYPEELTETGAAEGEDPRCGTQYAIRVGSSGIAESLDAVTDGVSIEMPSPGASIGADRVLIAGALGAELANGGVNVQTWASGASSPENEYPVYVNGGYFAGVVPVVSGAGFLNAVAAGYSGTVLSSSVSVTGSSAESPVTAVPETSPEGIIYSGETFTVTLKPELAGTLANSATSFAWDFNGDGHEDMVCSSGASVNAAYTSSGLYLPKLTVKDSSGTSYTDTTVVSVTGAGDLQDQFQAVWEAMKEKLLAGDIEGAMAFYSSRYLDRYRDLYNGLTAEQIAGIFAGLSTPYLDMALPGYAECSVFRESGSGYASYPVQFVMDDGVWRIYGY